MRIKTLLLLSASALLLASCGGDQPSPSSVPSSENESSKVSEAESNGPASTLPEESSSEGPLPAPSEEPSSEIESSEPAPTVKPNLFYQEGAVMAGQGETALKGGQLGWWAGDGGSISSLTHADGKYTLSYKAAGAWYGVQVFYLLPYSQSGDSYHIETTFHSDVAGSFTLNGAVITLEANQDYAYSADFTCASATVISLQMGVNGGGLMGGSTLTFTDPVIKDNGDNVYHAVEFKNGEESLKKIEVRSGKKVAAPADPSAPEGKIFVGWFDGEEQYNSDSAIVADKTYVARFADASEGVKNVTFKTADGAILKEVQVAQGAKVAKPSDVSIFAYSIIDWLTEDGASFDFASNVNEDLVLIAKTKIAPSTWFNAEECGWVIPEINQRVNEDGSFEVYDIAPFGGKDPQAFWSQVNFAPVPASEAGKNYVIEFDYMINGNGGDVQIFDNGTVGQVKTLVAGTEYAHMSLDFSQALTAGSKLTFELGAVKGVEKINFKVKNVVFNEK